MEQSIKLRGELSPPDYRKRRFLVAATTVIYPKRYEFRYDDE